eukprot:CAMPEP_0175956388 /NCGR_PEP_ID=MMETSP0108-20121206/33050_1 /TAXON_ID=195067 ORGANISM="Goniomonas pacifica, Strain CCMP1869" /NCGR_SAMPLE_ID=MMETSP0108 /ASSEMBLY_ACC=CAM_ASM_000204 /LENGTH=205 /DNA_ID=CAMNT_0017283397 /DNA_START=10 /DNA_END=627 /DNA_ORIENTATION=+
MNTTPLGSFHQPYEKEHGKHRLRTVLKFLLAVFLGVQFIAAALSIVSYSLKPEYEATEEKHKVQYDTNGRELKERCGHIHGFFVYSIASLILSSVCCCEAIVIARVGELQVAIVDKHFASETKHVLLHYLYGAMTVFTICNLITIVTYEAIYLLQNDRDCWPFVEGTPLLRIAIILQLATGFLRALIVVYVACRHLVKDWNRSEM